MNSQITQLQLNISGLKSLHAPQPTFVENVENYRRLTFQSKGVVNYTLLEWNLSLDLL